MTRLIFPVPIDVIEYPDDVRRMKATLNAAGYDASDIDIQRAWQAESESVCAGWLSIPDEDALLVSELKYRMVEVTDADAD